MTVRLPQLRSEYDHSSLAPRARAAGRGDHANDVDTVGSSLIGRTRPPYGSGRAGELRHGVGELLLVTRAEFRLDLAALNQHRVPA